MASFSGSICLISPSFHLRRRGILLFSYASVPLHVLYACWECSSYTSPSYLVNTSPNVQFHFARYLLKKALPSP